MESPRHSSRIRRVRKGLLLVLVGLGVAAGVLVVAFVGGLVAVELVPVVLLEVVG
jgi:hypothetical protein